MTPDERTSLYRLNLSDEYGRLLGIDVRLPRRLLAPENVDELLAVLREPLRLVLEHTHYKFKVKVASDDA